MQDLISMPLPLSFNLFVSLAEDSDQSPSPSEVRPSVPPSLSAGDIIWGPHGNFPSWPGKLMATAEDAAAVKVCWFGSCEETEVDTTQLQSLSDGLEAHHRERKRLRK